MRRFVRWIVGIEVGIGLVTGSFGLAELLGKINTGLLRSSPVNWPIVWILAATVLLSMAVVSIPTLVADWNKKKGELAIRELAALQESAEQFLTLHPNRTEQVEFVLYQHKYEKWLPVGMKFDEYAQRAAWFSAAIKIHGYLKGKRMIRKWTAEWGTPVTDQS